MALIEYQFRSQALDMEQTVFIVLPESKRDTEVPSFHPSRLSSPCRFPTVYLLHGTSQDESEWLRFTSMERYANQQGLALVTPSGQLSAYADMAFGEKWMTYIASELPNKLEKRFPLSASREDRFVCGLSMGGHGAAKIGLRYPERYAAIGALSNGNHAYKRVLDRAPTRSDAMPSALVDERHLLCWGLNRDQTPVGTQEDLYALALENLKGATRFHPCFIWLVLPTETFFPPGICAVFFDRCRGTLTTTPILRKSSETTPGRNGTVGLKSFCSGSPEK